MAMARGVTRGVGVLPAVLPFGDDQSRGGEDGVGRGIQDWSDPGQRLRLGGRGHATII